MDERARMMALLGPIAEEIRVEWRSNGLGFFEVGSQPIVIRPDGGAWRVYNELHRNETLAVVPDDELRMAVFHLVFDALRRMEYIRNLPGIYVELLDDTGEDISAFIEGLSDALGGLVCSLSVVVLRSDYPGFVSIEGVNCSISTFDKPAPYWLVSVEEALEDEDYITVDANDYAGLRDGIVKITMRALHNLRFVIKPTPMVMA